MAGRTDETAAGAARALLDAGEVVVDGGKRRSPPCAKLDGKCSGKLRRKLLRKLLRKFKSLVELHSKFEERGADCSLPSLMKPIHLLHPARGPSHAHPQSMRHSPPSIPCNASRVPPQPARRMQENIPAAADAPGNYRHTN